MPLLFQAASAQLYRFPTGANRSDVAWRQLVTEHFVVIYHTGLDSAAREAADVAEAIYPVVTGNLGTEVSGRTPMYLSNLDDVPNALAFADRFMFVWMRGIVDDMAPAGIRSSGRAKWLRGVITHEFTHIVIAHATKNWNDLFAPSAPVPRWFNEGTARAMEPDPWTSDLDMALRVAAVNGRLGYDLLEPGVLDGTLLYETGHSLVRYMLDRFGDSVIARILDGGKGFFGYDFERAVVDATGISMSEIRSDWQRGVIAMYAAQYAAREEAEEYAPEVSARFEVVFGARYAPDRRRLVLLGSQGRGRPSRLHLLDVDDSLRATGPAELLLDEGSVDPELSWSPDGRRLVIAKYRYGAHRALVHDLFLVDVPSGSLERLTSDASVRDPAWSPDGASIVAVAKRVGRDNLVLVDPSSGAITPLTRFDADVQMATPSWSPDGRHIAFSLFDESGRRSVAVIDRGGSGFRTLTSDTAISRYPVWSPDGSRIVFTSHADGIPNLHIMNADGSGRRAISAVGGALWSVQWVPSSDTILALSFDTRDRIRPRLVPSLRTAPKPQEPVIRHRFTTWRTAGFARRVPKQAVITSARVLDSGRYVSALHLRPLVPLLPVAEPGIDRATGEERTRIGVGTLWFDPQAKHLLFGYITGDVESGDPGGELIYVDNQFPFSISMHVDYSLAWRSRHLGRHYFQRNRNVALLFDLPIAHPDVLDIGHHVYLGAARRNLEPWNTADFVLDSSAAEPMRAHLTELIAGYRYGARTLFIDARYRRAEPALGSDVRYDRLNATVSLRWPITAGGDNAVLARVDGAAHVGSQLPQEHLRLAEGDELTGRLLSLVSALDPEPAFRVRGFEKESLGDRVAIASVGLQSRLPLLEDLFPLLTLFRPQAVLFAEAGAAWRSATPIVDADWRLGVGGELRSELLPRTWIGAGVARGIGSDGIWDLYLRLSQGL